MKMNKYLNQTEKRIVTGILGVCFLWTGCSNQSSSVPVTNTTTSSEISSSTTSVPHHEHKPPHHGTLVVLGKEFAHLEMVLDPETGNLTSYALDGEAENPVKLSQSSLQLQIIVDNDTVKNNFALNLLPISNVLTGETVGNTSEYSAKSDKLKGIKEFNAILTSVDIRGSEFKNITFNFPKGNDTD